MAEPKMCELCGGTGFEFPECNDCDRDGWVDDPKDDGTMTCPGCDGDAAELCDACEEGFLYE